MTLLPIRCVCFAGATVTTWLNIRVLNIGHTAGTPFTGFRKWYIDGLCAVWSNTMLAILGIRGKVVENGDFSYEPYLGSAEQQKKC